MPLDIALYRRYPEVVKRERERGEMEGNNRRRRQKRTRERPRREDTLVPRHVAVNKGFRAVPREINARRRTHASLSRARDEGPIVNGGVACCVANALAPSFPFITHREPSL